MEISEAEQEGLDIDWFFTDGEHVAFVASGGGKLPLCVSISKENIVLLAEYFTGVELKGDVIINPDLDKIIKNFDERYLNDFVGMARKGLFAFDKTALNKFSDLNYHLVASPLVPLKLHQLPPEITAILSKTKIKGFIAADFNINQFEV